MPKQIETPRNTQPCRPLKTAPKHLKGEARAKWNELMRVLDPSVCTERQKDAIIRYCDEWAAYRRAVDALEHEPAVVLNVRTGAQVPSAWAKIRFDSSRVLFSLGLKLGLIPNGRDIPGQDKAPARAKFSGLVK